MGFLRRILGGGKPADERASHGAPGVAPGGPATAATTGEGGDEAARDRELLRADAERLDDDLLQRQLRFADRSWTPPPQGGPRRADDGGGAADEEETGSR